MPRSELRSIKRLLLGFRVTGKLFLAAIHKL
jgi:hypothetical protein